MAQESARGSARGSAGECPLAAGAEEAEEAVAVAVAVAEVVAEEGEVVAEGERRRRLDRRNPWSSTIRRESQAHRLCRYR